MRYIEDLSLDFDVALIKEDQDYFSLKNGRGGVKQEWPSVAAAPTNHKENDFAPTFLLECVDEGDCSSKFAAAHLNPNVKTLLVHGKKALDAMFVVKRDFDLRSFDDKSKKIVLYTGHVTAETQRKVAKDWSGFDVYMISAESEYDQIVSENHGIVPSSMEYARCQY
jgi:hypothetical protein